MLYYIQAPSSIIKYDRYISYRFQNSRALIWKNADRNGCWINHGETYSLV